MDCQLCAVCTARCALRFLPEKEQLLSLPPFVFCADALLSSSFDGTCRIWNARDPAVPPLVLRADPLRFALEGQPTSRWAGAAQHSTVQHRAAVQLPCAAAQRGCGPSQLPGRDHLLLPLGCPWQFILGLCLEPRPCLPLEQESPLPPPHPPPHYPPCADHWHSFSTTPWPPQARALAAGTPCVPQSAHGLLLQPSRPSRAGGSRRQRRRAGRQGRRRNKWQLWASLAPRSSTP